MKDINYYEDLGLFNDDQMEEICYGLEKNLDVSIYAKPGFDQLQMQQIRWGLENGVDVSIYAKPEFNGWQMEQICYGIVENLDVSVYAKPEFNSYQMRQIRKGLENEIDVSAYAKPVFDGQQMPEIREEMEEEKNKKEYISTVAYANQLSELKQNVNGHGYRFLNLQLNDLLKNDEFKKNLGEVKKVSLIVPELAVKGAKANTVGDKLYSLIKDKDNKPVPFDKLELNDNKEKVSGEHSLAMISFQVPEEADKKYKVNMSIEIEEGKWESKNYEVSFDKLKQMIIENTKEVSNAIKKYKEKSIANGFVEVVASEPSVEEKAVETPKELKKVNIEEKSKESSHER